MTARMHACMHVAALLNVCVSPVHVPSNHHICVSAVHAPSNHHICVSPVHVPSNHRICVSPVHVPSNHHASPQNHVHSAADLTFSAQETRILKNMSQLWVIISHKCEYARVDSSNKCHCVHNDFHIYSHYRGPVENNEGMTWERLGDCFCPLYFT